jgi:nicotinamide-nucleotide adenylyltransferase
MSTALFVGRFQPFHNGHLAVIKDILQHHEHVYIVIGSAQESGTDRNPFSSAEREAMIRLALSNEKIHRYTVYRADDCNDDELWGQKIKALCRFDVAYSNNPVVKRCLEAQGFEVRKHKFYDRAELSGTDIRKLMKEDGEWEEFVPPAVATFIKKSRMQSENPL